MSCNKWCSPGVCSGPLLFTLYINDIPNIVHTNLNFFADDSEVYAITKALEDSEQLQADLNSIQDWCQIWLLKLNLLKCKVMRVGHSSIASEYVLWDNDSGEFVQLPEVDHEKDLGVWISSNLKPPLHCCKAAASAMKVLSMIRRSFVNISEDLFTFLYKTYVRPLLEYCSAIWSPYLAKDIDVLEKVQMRATRLIRGIGNLSYGQRLKSLGMYTLFSRRQRGDLIEVFKILNGFYNVKPNEFFTPAVSTNTRGHHMKLFKPHSRLNVRSNFFTQRVINLWNNLPKEIVSTNTVASFKAKLDKCWDSTGHGHEQRLTA